MFQWANFKTNDDDLSTGCGRSSRLFLSSLLRSLARLRPTKHNYNYLPRWISSSFSITCWLVASWNSKWKPAERGGRTKSCQVNEDVRLLVVAVAVVAFSVFRELHTICKVPVPMRSIKLQVAGRAQRDWLNSFLFPPRTRKNVINFWYQLVLVSVCGQNWNWNWNWNQN